MDDYKYWAFISYSHADEKWAGWLHRALEGYRIPSRLVGKPTPHGPVPKKLFPVFRDRDELAGSASLGPELQKALRSSRSLIVICSPRSAQSHWVNEEIKHFKSIGRADRVFALIVDGEPHALVQGDPELECFPEALRYEVDANGEVDLRRGVEPIAADARRHGDGRGAAKLKLIAGILGLGFDDLRQRELQARNRRLAMVAGLASGVAALTIVLAIQAYYARDDARRRQRQAEDLIQFMLGDLRQNLEPIGKLSILDAVGDKAMDYFGSLGEEDVTDAVLQSRATALRQIGEVRNKQGDLAGAAAAAREALKLDLELVERHPADAKSIFNVSQSQYYVGYDHYARGEWDEARNWWQQQLATMQRLVALEPQVLKWQTELAGVHLGLGGVAQFSGDPQTARAEFERGRDLLRAVVEQEPDNRGYLSYLADAYGWLTHLEQELGRNEAALEQARLQNGLYRRLAELDPDHADYRYRLAGGLMRELYIRSILKPLSPSANELQESLQLTAGLSQLDPTNLTYARLHYAALTYLENAYVEGGDVDAALPINRRSLELAQDLHRRASDSAEALDDLLGSHVRAFKLAWLRGDRAAARQALDDAITVAGDDPSAPGANVQRGLELHLMAQWTASTPEERERVAAEALRWKAFIDQSGTTPRPELMLRFAALNEDSASAERWAGKLTAVERAHPYLRQFCRDLNLRCAAAGAG